MVALINYNPPHKLNSLYFCGGAMISDEWILTAAHCLYKDTNDDTGERTLTDKSEIGVLIGAYDLDDDKKSKLVSRIEEFVIWPGFNDMFKYTRAVASKTINTILMYQNDDVALIRIKPITNPDIQYKTISLAHDLELIKHGRNVKLLGWGKNLDFVIQNILQEGDNSIINPYYIYYPNGGPNDNSEKLVYNVNGKKLSENKIYIIKPEPLKKSTNKSTEKSALSFTGDSGSPLLTYSDKLQRWVVIGVMSAAYANNDSEYTNLYYHTNWIKQVTGVDVGMGTFK